MNVLTKEALELELKAKRRAVLESLRKKKESSTNISTTSMNSSGSSSRKAYNTTNTSISELSTSNSKINELQKEDIFSTLYDAVVDLQTLGYSFNMIVEQSGINKTLLLECFKKWNFPVPPQHLKANISESPKPMPAQLPRTPSTANINSRSGSKVKTNVFSVLNDAPALTNNTNNNNLNPHSSRSPSLSSTSLFQSANNSSYSINNNRPRYNNKVFNSGNSNIERPDWLDDLVLDFQTTDDDETYQDDEYQDDEEEKVIVINEEDLKTSSDIGTPVSEVQNDLSNDELSAQEGLETLKQRNSDLFDKIHNLSKYVGSNDLRKFEEMIKSTNASIYEKEKERAFLAAKLKTLDVNIQKDKDKLGNLTQEMSYFNESKANLATLLVEQEDLERKLAASRKSSSKKKKRKLSTSVKAAKRSEVETIELSDDEKAHNVNLRNEQASASDTNSQNNHLIGTDLHESNQEVPRDKVLGMKRKSTDEQQQRSTKQNKRKKPEQHQDNTMPGIGSPIPNPIDIDEQRTSPSSSTCKLQIKERQDQPLTTNIEPSTDKDPSTDPIEITDDEEQDVQETSDPCDSPEEDFNRGARLTLCSPGIDSENPKPSEVEYPSNVYGDTIHKIEKAQTSEFKPYVSYGLCKQTSTNNTLQHNADGQSKNDQLCPMELTNGKCNEKSCEFQHLSEMS